MKRKELENSVDGAHKRLAVHGRRLDGIETRLSCLELNVFASSQTPNNNDIREKLAALEEYLGIVGEKVDKYVYREDK